LDLVIRLAPVSRGRSVSCIRQVQAAIPFAHRTDAVMPELPDVESFKRVVTRSALRKTIDRVVVSDARILGNLSAGTLVARLEGAKLLAARRHGKHLMASIDRGGWLTLHFGMTGALHFVRKLEKEPPFTRVRLDFADDGCLAYTNKRMIGRVGLVEDVADFIADEKLGPDALDRRFDFHAFKTAVLGIKRDVKSVLMDQQIIAGVGNIYSDEILFWARIDPALRMDKLAASQLKHVFLQIRKVLKTAIACGAGSEQFTDRMPAGALLPERKKGGHCPRCRSQLKVFKVGGRTAYCCPQCQNC
jgi:formamidopyrimidine-DNA glycosylase